MSAWRCLCQTALILNLPIQSNATQLLLNQCENPAAAVATETWHLLSVKKNTAYIKPSAGPRFNLSSTSLPSTELSPMQAGFPAHHPEWRRHSGCWAAASSFSPPRLYLCFIALVLSACSSVCQRQIHHLNCKLPQLG